MKLLSQNINPGPLPHTAEITTLHSMGARLQKSPEIYNCDIPLYRISDEVPYAGHNIFYEGKRQKKYITLDLHVSYVYNIRS